MPEPAFTIADAAALVRSKNAGPFWLTIDVMFKEAASYGRACRSAQMAPDALSRLLRIDPQGLVISKMDAVSTIKISFPRRVSAGSPRDSDTLGGQQYAAILGLRIT
jgi:hypothetical protein